MARSAYFEYLFAIVVAVYAPRNGEDSGGLSCPRGSVEQKMGKPILINEFFNCGWLMPSKIMKVRWSYSCW